MAMWSEQIRLALLQPFPVETMEFLPRQASGGRALALPYIEARDVMRRLDEVVGPENWSFEFDLLDDKGRLVRGRLTVLGSTKWDAGEASSEDELLKSAVSDALKRCGVHFGIGRYLYYLPRIWAAYDSQKKTWAQRPSYSSAQIAEALSLSGAQPLSEAQPGPAPRLQRAPAQAPVELFGQEAPAPAPAPAAPRRPAPAPAREAAPDPEAHQPSPTKRQMTAEEVAAATAARSAHFARLNEIYPGVGADMQRALAAVWAGRAQPFQAKQRSHWDAHRWTLLTQRMEAADPAQSLDRARQKLQAAAVGQDEAA